MGMNEPKTLDEIALEIYVNSVGLGANPTASATVDYPRRCYQLAKLFVDFRDRVSREGESAFKKS